MGMEPQFRILILACHHATNLSEIHCQLTGPVRTGSLTFPAPFPSASRTLLVLPVKYLVPLAPRLRDEQNIR